MIATGTGTVELDSCKILATRLKGATLSVEIITRKIDDVTKDVVEEVEPITIILQGRIYEIDASPDTLRKFQERNKKYLRAARTHTDSEAQEIRQWARQNGIAVSARGRLPQEVIKMYDDAHGETTDGQPEAS